MNVTPQVPAIPGMTPLGIPPRKVTPPTLGELPIVDPSRRKLRDVVTLKPETLATRAHKFLSMSADYTARKSFRNAYFREALPANVVPGWTKRRGQSPCGAFESGSNCLPGMEAFAAQVIG